MLYRRKNTMGHGLPDTTPADVFKRNKRNVGGNVNDTVTFPTRSFAPGPKSLSAHSDVRQSNKRRVKYDNTNPFDHFSTLDVLPEKGSRVQVSYHEKQNCASTNPGSRQMHWMACSALYDDRI